MNDMYTNALNLAEAEGIKYLRLCVDEFTAEANREPDQHKAAELRDGAETALRLAYILHGKFEALRAQVVEVE